MSKTLSRTVMKIGFAALAMGAGLSVTGCADFARVMSLKPEKIDPNSPVATEVNAASRKSYATPSFKDVPPIPKDVRPATAFGQAARASAAQRDRVAAYVEAHPPETPLDPAATEAFAAAERAKIPADQRALAPEPAGTDDYAAKLRALATPPPPPK